MSVPTIHEMMLLLWRMEYAEPSTVKGKDDVQRAKAILDLLSEWFPKETLDWFMEMTVVKPYEVDWR